MKLLSILLVQFMFVMQAYSAEHYATGKVTALLGSAEDPAIMVGSSDVPSLCDGGDYGWLYFSGTPQDRQWIYATAMAMAVTGKTVVVYTNTDGEKCRIGNIQVTSGLN